MEAILERDLKDAYNMKHNRDEQIRNIKMLQDMVSIILHGFTHEKEASGKKAESSRIKDILQP